LLVIAKPRLAQQLVPFRLIVERNVEQAAPPLKTGHEVSLSQESQQGSDARSASTTALRGKTSQLGRNMEIVRWLQREAYRQHLDQPGISLRVSILEGEACHCAVPTPKVFEVRKLRFATEEIVLDHTVVIVVDEQWAIGDQVL
jgi:hypothetical protein